MISDMSQPNDNYPPRRWKRGDVHPDTGLVFWKYDPKARGGEYWITSERMAEVRARKRKTDAEWRTTEAGRTAAREAKRRQRSSTDGRERDRAAKRKWGRSKKGRASFARWYEKAMASGTYQAHRRERVRTAKAEARSTELGRMIDRLRARAYDCFARIGCGKPTLTTDLLGCDWQTARDWIERQFTDGMTWATMGRWHIDHIVPLCTAKDANELRDLCHYTNLRPLPESFNLGRRRDGSDLWSRWPR